MALPQQVRRRHVAMLGIAVAPEAQGQGVGTALMQAMCDYADRWLGLLRHRAHGLRRQRGGDHALSQVRLRDRGSVSRLRDARRPAGRRVLDGADPSGAADHRSPSGGCRRSRGVRIARALALLPGAGGFGRRRRRGAGLVSQPRRRGQRAGRPHRPLVSGRAPPAPSAPAPGGGAVPRLRRRLRPARPADAGGCSDYAALFNRAGYSALVVDSLTPRYEVELCTQRNGSRRVTQSNRRLDALGAVAYLAERADVDPRRIGLVGWSNGGSTVLAATNLRHRDVAAALVAAGLRGRLLSRLRGRPEARLRGGGAAPDAGRPGRRLDRGGAVPRALAREAGGVQPGDRGLRRRVPRLRSATQPVRLRKDVPNGVNPGQGVHVGGNAAAWRASQARLLEFIGLLSVAVIDGDGRDTGRPPHRHGGAGKHRRRADGLAPADRFAERRGRRRRARPPARRRHRGRRETRPQTRQAQVDRVADDGAEEREPRAARRSAWASARHGRSRP